MMPRYRPSLTHSVVPVHWVADFIRKERVRRKKSQRQLANECAVTQQVICNLETGDTLFSFFSIIERILAALGYKLHIRKKGSQKNGAQQT